MPVCYRFTLCIQPLVQSYLPLISAAFNLAMEVSNFPLLPFISDGPPLRKRVYYQHRHRYLDTRIAPKHHHRRQYLLASSTNLRAPRSTIRSFADAFLLLISSSNMFPTPSCNPDLPSARYSALFRHPPNTRVFLFFSTYATYPRSLAATYPRSLAAHLPAGARHPPTIYGQRIGWAARIDG